MTAIDTKPTIDDVEDAIKRALRADVSVFFTRARKALDVMVAAGLFVPEGFCLAVHGGNRTELVKALQSKEVKDLFAKQGLEAAPGTPEELAAFMKREYDTWGKVVKQAGIKPQ